MPIGTSDGQYFENVYDYYKRTSDAKEMAANETSGDFQSRFGAVETTPRMPIGATEKLTGALKQEGATRVAKDTPENGNQTIGEKYNLPEAPTGKLPGIISVVKGMMNPQPIGEELHGLYESAKKFFMGPGEAYKGNMAPEQMEQWSREAALWMVGAPAPVAGKLADGTLGSFAGVKSKALEDPWVRKALYTAQTKELGGATSEEIWGSTGFFRGADNRWRHEIDDSGIKVNLSKFNQFAGNDKYSWDHTYRGSDPTYELNKNVKDFFGKTKDSLLLKDILEHPELYRQYPELALTKVEKLPQEAIDLGHAGHMDIYNNTIRLGRLSEENVKSVLLHEIQHKIQDIEGFANGIDSREFRPGGWEVAESKLKEAKQWLDAESIHKGLTQEEHVAALHAGREQAWTDFYNKTGVYDAETVLIPELQHALDIAKQKGLYDQYINIGESERLLEQASSHYYDLYMRTMGEVEARNVQTRRNWDLSQRLGLSPRRSESRPHEEQINTDELRRVGKLQEVGKFSPTSDLHKEKRPRDPR